MGRARRRRRRFTTRPPLERMQWLDRQLRQGAYPGAADAAAVFEVSRRTILRDIDYMRLMLGAPIEYDRRRKGYRRHLPLVACFAATRTRYWGIKPPLSRSSSDNFLSSTARGFKPQSPPSHRDFR